MFVLFYNIWTRIYLNLIFKLWRILKIKHSDFTQIFQKFYKYAFAWMIFYFFLKTVFCGVSLGIVGKE